MTGIISRLLAGLSLTLRQPLYSFCDVETTHGDALVTKHSDYVSVVRVDGMRRMSTRQDVARIATAQRLELSGSLESRGHAIVGWFASDPELAHVEIDRLNMDSCRRVAQELNLDLSDILDERAKLWPKIMRWEAAYYILWTRKAVLTKEERKQMKEEQDGLAREFPRVGDSQRFYLRSDIMAARHGAFVNRVLASLRNHDIAAVELDAHDALKLSREALYRETAGSAWRPSLIGDRPMPRLPEENEKPHPEGLLWPALREQIFHADALTKGGQRVQIGDYEYANVDMNIGPEDPRPFVELSAALGKDRIPWRAAVVVEGGGKAAMAMKEIAAGFLAMFPNNTDLRRAFAALEREREQNNHISVKMRASFATWAPVEEGKRLRRRISTLSQRVEGWGNCKATSVSGDPLEGVMSTVPALSLASTANPSLALLGDALAMLPWNRTASPWERGSVLFRRPDGAIWPYDPAGGSMRPLVLDIFVAPPGSGKSVLANTINLGLCLSTAVMGSRGAKLPLIGKADIGPSAQGFVRLVQEALGPERRHEAIFVTMQFARGYEVNIFDTQVGCESPLPLERAFLQNFLALGTLPPDKSEPFEGMPQLIGLVIDEAYRLCTDVPGGSPKPYRAGVEREVDEALRRNHVKLEHDEPWWRDVVNALIDLGDYRLAAVAQRHAVPILQDLVNASRSEQVRDMFETLKIASTQEELSKIFNRYIQDLIRRFPDAEQPDQAGLRAGAHHRARLGGRGADRLGRREPADRDDVHAGPAHPGPELLPAPGLRAIRAGEGARVSPAALPGGGGERQAPGLRRVAPHRGQPAGPRPGRARRARGPQAQHPARLLVPAAEGHGRRDHVPGDRSLHPAGWRRAGGRADHQPVQPDRGQRQHRALRPERSWAAGRTVPGRVLGRQRQVRADAGQQPRPDRALGAQHHAGRHQPAQPALRQGGVQRGAAPPGQGVPARLRAEGDRTAQGRPPHAR